jgi:hypothetical protein
MLPIILGGQKGRFGVLRERNADILLTNAVKGKVVAELLAMI